MDMSWLTCPRCTGVEARAELRGRELTELTIVEGAAPVAESAPLPEPPQWVALLASVEGPASGARYELPPGRYKVGRGPRPDGDFQLLTVPDPGISRDHFVLEAGRAAVVLRDLGSTNGTRVNGSRVDRHILQDGDVIRAGQTSLQVRLAPRVPEA